MTSATREFALRVTAVVVLGLVALIGACTAPPPTPMRPEIPTPPARDFVVATAYPTLAELYQGAQGIYRGCAPNGNVCHNSRQYPNLNTLGAIALNVNQPCNQLQDDPTRIDDWCERQGDTVRIAGQRLTLAYIQRVADATETTGSRWAIAVQGEFPMLTEDTGLSIVRVREGLDDDTLISFDADMLTPDPERRNVVFAQLEADDESRERRLLRAGIPAERDAVQFGDPNRNGVFGVGMGNRLIYAGHPERSYIIRRLTDPSAGPLMPLANCCFWSKASLRALWCWIAGLREDGSNAMDPIDYSVCPDGPVENVTYPEPGPNCENGGLCPVRARDPIPDEPTWANVYANIFVPRCGGNGCHRSGDPAGALDLGTSEVAYDQLLHSMPPRVMPGNAEMSLLYYRVTQTCDTPRNCRRMPLGQAPLPDNEVSVIRRWIENGARMDGMITDAGMGDSGPDGGTDASIADVPGTDTSMPDVGTDAGAPDTAVLDTAVPDTATPEMDTGVDAATPSDAGMDAAAD